MFFNGVIDEARIYNRALTGDEVLNRYRSGQPNSSFEEVEPAKSRFYKDWDIQEGFMAPRDWSLLNAALEGRNQSRRERNHGLPTLITRMKSLALLIILSISVISVPSVVKSCQENKKLPDNSIQSATLNSRPLNKPWFYHSELVGGGQLILEMGPEPNRNWGSKSDDAPPSMSSHDKSI